MGFFANLFGRKTEHTEELTKQQITEQLLQAILERYQGFTGEILHPDVDDEISICIYKDNETVCNIYPDNLYAVYQSKDIEAYQDYKERLLTSLASTLLQEELPQVETMLPAFKNMDWISNIQNMTEGRKAVYKLICADIALVFALDSTDQIRYLMEDEVEAQSDEELLAQALENFAQRLNEHSIQAEQTDMGMILHLDNNYDASLLLLHQQWLPDLALQGEPVIGLFARDLLVIADSANPHQLETIKLFAEQKFAELAYCISPHLLTIKDGNITLYRSELAS